MHLLSSLNTQEMRERESIVGHKAQFYGEAWKGFRDIDGPNVNHENIMNGMKITHKSSSSSVWLAFGVGKRYSVHSVKSIAKLLQETYHFLGKWPFLLLLDVLLLLYLLLLLLLGLMYLLVSISSFIFNLLVLGSPRLGIFMCLRLSCHRPAFFSVLLIYLTSARFSTGTE
jgi:hypothetical protein